MCFLTASALFLVAWQADSKVGENIAENKAPTVSLTVASEVPLRLYLTKRIPKRLGAPVEGKIMESVFAFDREVLPAGSAVTGRVTAVHPVNKWQRFRAIVGGDFTPLRNALVEFDGVTLSDGKKLLLHTAGTIGLNSIYIDPPRKKHGAAPKSPNGGTLGTAKQTVKDKIQDAINARSGGLMDIVRGPNKREKLEDFLWAKLPYHPQYMRRGTRFDAPLQEALQFGAEPVKVTDLAQLGSQPSSDSVARVRLLTPLDSASARQGQTVDAVLAAPLFSAAHKLVLPEGTHLLGMVTMARGARSFHRTGRLRFTFQKVELAPEVANLRPTAPEVPALGTQATLAAAEGSGSAPIKVDSEGGVQVQESKTRFIAPVISLLLASKSADNDAGHHSALGASGSAATSGANANVSGRTLGGVSGFGLLGAAVSQSSPYVGMAFGYYGLAWSVYSNVIAKGGEVQFEKNAMMDIRFGGRVPVPASQFRAVVAHVSH
jgi:hypothetical protein